MAHVQPGYTVPTIHITEQPRQRGMRFRYECEGRSAGSIPGTNTTAERKTWPTVQIRNYIGEVRLRVSLVTKDNPPRPHPHSLVGKDCENGICQVVVNQDTQMTACFSNLGIQCVKRKEVQEALKDRKRLRVDPFGTFNDADDHPSVDIDLATVKLCFEGFIIQGNRHHVLTPVVSHPIFDKKATASSLLKICRVDKTYGNCKGGTEVYLLCDKVQKDDISICFFANGWEAYGEFSPTDVHRQVAIVFRTPPYRDPHIREATKVMFQLKRTSDGETSEAKDFTYLPINHDQPNLPFKRPYPNSEDKKPVRDAIRQRLSSAPLAKQSKLDMFVPVTNPHQMQPMMMPFPGRLPDSQSTTGSMVSIRRPIIDEQPELTKDVLNDFLRSNLPSQPSPFSTGPFSPGDMPGPSSRFPTQGDSSQFSTSQWLPVTHAPGLSVTGPPPVQFPGSSGPSFPVSTKQQMPSASIFSSNQISNLDLLEMPGIESISSLQNVSFGSFDPNELGDSMKNLSIEEEINISDLVKQEQPPTDNVGFQHEAAFSPPQQSPHMTPSMVHPIQYPPNTEPSTYHSYQTHSNIPLSPESPFQTQPSRVIPAISGPVMDTLQQGFPVDGDDTLPSFDLEDPQGQFSIEGNQSSDIDAFVRDSTSNQ